MAKRPNATQEFRTARTRSSSRTQTTVAYRTARIARARQKRELEMQKREKLIFALIVVTILVMIILAILIFKKVIETDSDYHTDTTETSETQDTTPPAVNTSVTVSVTKSEVNKGYLLLIDGDHRYTGTSALKNIAASRTKFPHETKGHVYSYYTANYEPVLEENTLAALNELCDAFYSATGNNDLYIKKAYDEDSVAHVSGYTVDLGIFTLEQALYPLDASKFADTYDWFFKNYYKYGFIIDKDADHDFCFRYVGIPHACYMYENDISLKEYLALIREKTISFTVYNGDSYEVSYVHAGGDVISVTLPSADSEYEISGDNMEGIIVTVKK